MKENKTPIVAIVSVLLLGVTGYFIYRGIRASKETKRKLEEEADRRRRQQGQSGSTPSTGLGSIFGGGDAGSESASAPTPVAVSVSTVRPRIQSVLRKDPNTRSAMLKKFVKSQDVTVTGAYKIGLFTWYKVSVDGLEGYIRADQVIA